MKKIKDTYYTNAEIELDICSLGIDYIYNAKKSYNKGMNAMKALGRIEELLIYAKKYDRDFSDSMRIKNIKRFICNLIVAK